LIAAPGTGPAATTAEPNPNLIAMKHHPLALTALVTALTAVLTTAATANAADDQIATNPAFNTAGDNGAPAGWDWRTQGQGFVKTHASGGDADPTYVEIGVLNADEDSFIQQIVPLPEDAQRVRITVKYRYFDVEAGDRGHEKGFLQGRFTEQGDDFGSWIDIDKFTGSQPQWQEKTRLAGVPDKADGLMIRLGGYGLKAGRVEVALASVEKVTADDIAAERAKYRPEEPFGEPVSDERWARFEHGININNWFCQPWNVRVKGEKGGFNAEHFASYITADDMKLIKSMGFDHVRLPIDPVFLMDTKTGDLKTDLLPELDKAIQLIREHDLAVIADIHPKSNSFKRMRTKPDTAKNFIVWWGHFARHMAETTDPEYVLLELLNEPGGQSYYGDTWIAYQDKLLMTVRENAPRHTIVVNPGGYMLWKDLEKIEDPHPDRNTIWAVHFYEPSPFTHQGAVWMKDWYRPLRDVPFPLTADNIDAAKAAVVEKDDASDKAKQVLDDMLRSGWISEAKLGELLGTFAAWGEKHDRRVHVGEWGVYTKYAPRDSRLRYLGHMAAAMDARGLHWAKWDYSGAGFEIVAPDEPGQRQPDAEVIEALGLND